MAKTTPILDTKDPHGFPALQLRRVDRAELADKDWCDCCRRTFPERSVVHKLAIYLGLPYVPRRGAAFRNATAMHLCINCVAELSDGLHRAESASE
jgi:hypothetical protein